MKKILIADAGSTKIDWLLVSPDEGPEKALRHTTSGINAAITPDEEISSIVKEVSLLEGWNDKEIGQIYYYGAGCFGEAINKRVHIKLYSTWREAEIEVSSDLLGAARALHGNQPGIACILGTGSNSGFHDGKKIVSNVPSLGFILGDEGSGSSLGKRLISDVFKNDLPTRISNDFMEYLGMTLPEIIERVYRRPNPNSFLASVVPFIKENLWNPYIYALVLKEMTYFIKRNVAKYENARRLPLGFVGSIAWYFQDQLRDATEACGFSIKEIIKSPIDKLSEFHSRESSPFLS